MTEEILCANLWSIFRKEGEENPWYFFHKSGKGVYFNLIDETEFNWELSDHSVLTMTSDDSSISFEGKHYRKIFMGWFDMERQLHILLFDSAGAKEQLITFSN